MLYRALLKFHWYVVTLSARIKSIEVNIDDEVFPNAMILPDQVILGVVPQFYGVISENFVVIRPTISQKSFYFLQINLGKLASLKDFLKPCDSYRVLYCDLILYLSQ